MTCDNEFELYVNNKRVTKSDNWQNLIAVPLKDVVGRRKVVPLDHEWVTSARRVGVCMGDKPPL